MTFTHDWDQVAADRSRKIIDMANAAHYQHASRVESAIREALDCGADISDLEIREHPDRTEVAMKDGVVLTVVEYPHFSPPHI